MNFSTALRKHPIVFLMPVVVLIAVGIALGARRHPTYKATAEINVGVLSVSAQATPGYTQASLTLASAYSRQVGGRALAADVAQRAGVSTGDAAGRISSSAVPSSPTFFIYGTGTSAANAITLTKAATAALIALAGQAQNGQPSVTSLLRRYEAAQGSANRLQDNQQQIAQSVTSSASSARGVGATGPLTIPAAGQARIRQARLNEQVAVLQATALASQYSSSTATSRGPLLQVLNPPTSASNDRKTVTERYAIVGAAAGAALGALLIFFLAARRPRRTLTEPV